MHLEGLRNLFSKVDSIRVVCVPQPDSQASTDPRNVLRGFSWTAWDTFILKSPNSHLLRPPTDLYHICDRDTQ